MTIVTHDPLLTSYDYFYLCQGGYVFVVVCLSVCLLATLCKNVQTDLHEIFTEGCNEPVNKWLNFGGSLDHGSAYGSRSVSRHW